MPHALLVAALVVGGLVSVNAGPARAADGVPDPFFGTWSDGISPSPEESGAAMDRQVAIGVGLMRQYVWWDRIEQYETSPGSYNWTRTDQLVTDATARGLRILPTLLYPPAWYSSKPAGSTSNALFPPTDPETMARWAEAMVRRYGPNGSFWCTPHRYPFLFPPNCKTPQLPITAWEVWNEPDFPSWWKGKPDPAEYATLLRAVSAGIRRADPTAEVVLGSLTSGAPGGLAFKVGGYLDRLYQQGVKDTFDTIAVNPYGRDVATMLEHIRGARQIATLHGDGDKPIRVTEYGWATGGKTTSAQVTTPPCQAALLHAATTRLSDLRAELGVSSIIQFQWHDYPDNGTNLWPFFAGVEYVDGTPKPSRAALAEAIAGRPAPAGLSLTEACPADRQTLDHSVLQRLTVATAGIGSGRVTSAPAGIDCGTTCVKDFSLGTSVTLTALPATGSSVETWSDPSCQGTTCTVSMTADRAVTATFTGVPGPGSYEETDSAITYSGTWVTSAGTGDSGGSVRLASSGPAAAALTFNGTGVRWVTRKGPSAGINRVYVDAALVATVDRYSSVAQSGVTGFTSAALPLGQHTIRVEHTGTKNAAATDDDVVLDAFVVSGTLTLAPVADAYANKGAPATNFGTSASLASRGNPGYASYLRYALPTLPSGVSLQSATLRLRTNTETYAGSADPHVVQEAPDSWTETALTWNNRPVPTGPTLGSLAGGTAHNSVYDVAIGPAALQALLGAQRTLAVTSAGTDNLWFWSRNHANAGYRPQLTLTFR